MKRFLVFAGDCFYPSGGWNDFIGDFDSKEEAAARAKEKRVKDYWSHVVDATTMRIIIDEHGKEVQPS